MQPGVTPAGSVLALDRRRRSWKQGRDYQRIPSLQEYVLVSQESRIEICRRQRSGNWEYLDVREGVVKLASGGTLALSVLYANLPA